MKKPKVEANNVDSAVEQIYEFVGMSQGLKMGESQLTDYLVIEQSIDDRQITINTFDLDEVLFREDEAGKPFLQVNFASGKKILLTDALVGFRPLGLYGLDMEKLPKVVTTPDIQSVYEAIQESLQASDGPEELEVLRKVFDSVVCGGESVGFDLKEERSLYSRIPTQVYSGAA